MKAQESEWQKKIEDLLNSTAKEKSSKNRFLLLLLAIVVSFFLAVYLCCCDTSEDNIELPPQELVFYTEGALLADQMRIACLKEDRHRGDTITQVLHTCLGELEINSTYANLIQSTQWANQIISHVRSNFGLKRIKSTHNYPVLEEGWENYVMHFGSAIGDPPLRCIINIPDPKRGGMRCVYHSRVVPSHSSESEKEEYQKENPDSDSSNLRTLRVLFSDPESTISIKDVHLNIVGGDTIKAQKLWSSKNRPKYPMIGFVLKQGDEGRAFLEYTRSTKGSREKTTMALFIGDND